MQPRKGERAGQASGVGNRAALRAYQNISYFEVQGNYSGWAIAQLELYADNVQYFKPVVPPCSSARDDSSGLANRAAVPEKVSYTRTTTVELDAPEIFHTTKLKRVGKITQLLPQRVTHMTTTSVQLDETRDLSYNKAIEVGLAMVQLHDPESVTPNKMAFVKLYVPTRELPH